MNVAAKTEAHRKALSYAMTLSLAIGLLMFIMKVSACAAGRVAASSFEFVVIGDTRPRFESENFQEFEVLIPMINRVKPAFVLNVGDLIYGYGPLSKEKQWDRYAHVIKSLQPQK